MSVRYADHSQRKLRRHEGCRAHACARSGCRAQVPQLHLFGRNAGINSGFRGPTMSTNCCVEWKMAACLSCAVDGENATRRKHQDTSRLALAAAALEDAAAPRALRALLRSPYLRQACQAAWAARWTALLAIYCYLARLRGLLA